MFYKNFKKNLNFYAFTGILLCLSMFSCRKDDKIDIGLNIIENVPDMGLQIRMRDSIVKLNIERQALLTAGENETINYAYPDLISVNDTAMMVIAKSSPENIDDFANATLIKLQSSNRGRTWSKDTQPAHYFEGAINTSHPSIVRTSDTNLLLIYAVKYSLQRIDVVVEESNNNGISWSEPTIIGRSNSGYQILNNARTLIANGRIFVPVSIPLNGDMNSYRKEGSPVMVVFYYYSDDLGKTWNKSEALKHPSLNLFEPGIIHVDGNELLMNIRTDVGKVIFARSYNFGASWHFEQSNIDSPSAPQIMRRIPGTQRIIMAWTNNNVNVSIHGGNRSPLSLAISDDGGRNWTKILNIEEFNNFSVDHSYTGIAFDNKFAYFTYNARSNASFSFAIRLAKIPLEELLRVSLIDE